jgi:hypothetical protein
MSDITPFGITNFRNTNKPFGIKDNDRFGHIYCIGKTGTGKSTLLLNMAISDIERGHGVCVIDPHGDIAETILSYIPKERIQDVLYFNPKDLDYPISFNPLWNIKPSHHHIAVSGLIATFKKIWSDSWGPRLEYILRFALHTLLEYPKATLLDIQPLLTDFMFRNKVLSYNTSIHIHQFWRNEFEKYSPALKAEAITPILNKIGIFATSQLLRNIVGQKNHSIPIGELMDNKKIIIANLSKGEIGEDATSLLGSMLITAIQLAALARSAQPEVQRKPFYVYVDEMHSFVSLSFADILAEARKYKLSLFLTHQYAGQVHEKILSAIIGNVGTLICFRVGSEDAVKLKYEFAPVFSEVDLIALPRFSMYIKLMIDGATSKPFSAKTIALRETRQSYEQEIIRISRKLFARYFVLVEAEMSEAEQEIKQKKEQTLFTMDN